MTIVRIPLDVICVKTGVLCPSCQRKVDEGIVKPIEVDIMRVLLNLENEIKELRNATYEKTYQVDNTLIVVIKVDKASNELAKKIRQALVKELGRDYRIRVLLKSEEDPRQLVSQLLIPLTVKGINIMWLPDGTQKYVVNVRGPLRRLAIPKEQVEKILEEILGAPVEIRVETPRRSF
ncbi:putative transcription elongation factor [Ignicoccus hospitalis KIN4/I]|uniref:Putative transcription elongation factor n=2 Tax=Ignicoccus TaxID=54258 RepID=A8A8J1_IGNH4|nr:putative transcription elongation factor [Ignicoccus hospitalis KIN4/I]